MILFSGPPLKDAAGAALTSGIIGSSQFLKIGTLLEEIISELNNLYQ